MNTAKYAVGAFREAVNDLLIPEIKSIKVSIDSLRMEMQLRNEKQTESIQHPSQKLDFAIDIRERLDSLETRLPRQ